MNAFVEVLKTPKSYREAAQYFHGISRQAIKAWVLRKAVPEKHIPDFVAMSDDLGFSYTEEDFRNLARAHGGHISIETAKRALKADWESYEKRLKKYASCFTKDNDKIEDAAHDAILAMMERGRVNIGYGCRCVQNWFYARSKYFKEDPASDVVWDIIEKTSSCFATQELAMEVSDAMRAIDQLPHRYAGLARMLAVGEEKEDIAIFLEVEPQSVASYVSHVRRMIKDILNDTSHPSNT